MMFLFLSFCFRFSRGSVQTILPPIRNLRAGRLCTSLGERIAEMEKEATEIKQTKMERERLVKKFVNKRKELEYEIRTKKVK
jgi:structural maintenance of chromosomes protein 6